VSELVADCPRCGAKQMTFDVWHALPLYVKYDWQYWWEAFSVCRKCRKSTVFVLYQKDLEGKEAIEKGLARVNGCINRLVGINGYIGLKDMAAKQPPDHVPDNINAVFREGAVCLAVGCFNAAGTMFRLCVDLCTRTMLPVEDEKGLNSKIRRDLGLRFPWLFDNGILPKSLKDLSSCIKDDGNDGAHQGTLKKEDAEDLLDFTYALLERIYAEPKRIELAKERRTARREPKS